MFYYIYIYVLRYIYPEDEILWFSAKVIFVHIAWKGLISHSYILEDTITLADDTVAGAFGPTARSIKIGNLRR